MAAPGGDFQVGVGRQAPAVEGGEGDDRIVLRHQDVGRHLQPGQPVAGDRVPVEVGLQRAELGVVLDQPGGQRTDVQLQHAVVPVAQLGEQIALAAQRAGPFAPEVPVVHRRAVLDALHRDRRVQHRADRGHAAQRHAGRGRAQCQAQHEVPTQRVAGRDQRQLGPAAGDVAGGLHHFIDAVGVEDAGIEVMGVAVVAEVQPDHVVAFLQQPRGGHAHVAGFGTAFPAMQQQRHADRLASLDIAVPALQADAFATIEDEFVGVRAGGRKQHQAALHAHPAGAEHRLQVRIAQPTRRLIVGSGQHGREPAPGCDAGA